MSDSTVVIDHATGEVQTDAAWKRHQRIVALRNSIQRDFLDMGEELYWLEINKEYEALGHDTFNAYLADPDVDIGRSTAFRCKDVYARYIMQLESPPGGLLEAGVKKLEMARRYVTAENAEELIAAAAATSRSDFKLWLLDRFPPLPAPPLPAGIYNVIYADPPWTYSNSGFDQSAASKYDTMSTDDICKLPIEARAADDAVLFMWATSPLLPDGVRVVEAWGFEYKASMVWVKNSAPGMGWWMETKHELLLIGSRGSMLPTIKPNSIITDNVTEHSRKPEIVYTIIEDMYPGGKFLELFARRPRAGWESFGNELAE